MYTVCARWVRVLRNQPLIKRLCQLVVPGPTKAVLSLNIAIPEIETLSELQTSGKASEGLGFPEGSGLGLSSGSWAGRDFIAGAPETPTKALCNSVLNQP